MIYKHFSAAISIRVIIIIVLSVISSYLLFVKQDYSLSIIPIFLLVIALINIIKYFNKINQWIAFFLLGIENEDTTLKAPTKSGNRAIDDIYLGISRLNDMFKQTKIEINTQEQYYRSIIDQSATGLFSINENGRVININPAAIKLTGLQSHQHINVLSAIDEVLPEFIIHPIMKNNEDSAIFENHYGQKILFKMSEIISQEKKIRLVAVSDITKEEIEEYVSEGVDALVPYRGTTREVLAQLVGGLQSGMSYTNAHSIEELYEKATFVRMTPVGLRESHPHDVSLG